MRANEVSGEKVFKAIIAANELLNKYSNHDPFYIANCLGIRVIFTKLTENVKAFIAKDPYGPTIYIDERVDNYSRKILCAHELGHYSNGDIDYCPALFDTNIDSEKEYLANVFMSVLLPQVETKLHASTQSDIEEINKYFDSLIYYRHDAYDAGGLKILNDSSTIFDM